MKKFLIVLHNGKKYEIKKESKERLMSWLNTSVAGFLRRKDFVRFSPQDVKEIIELVDKDEEKDKEKEEYITTSHP